MKAHNTTTDHAAVIERKTTWGNIESAPLEDSWEHVWLYVKPDTDGNHKRVPKYICAWIQFSLRNYCVERDKWGESFRKRRENGFEDRAC